MDDNRTGIARGDGTDAMARCHRQRDGRDGVRGARFSGGTAGARRQAGIRSGQHHVGGEFGRTLPVGLDLPCTEDPELFFAESPEDVETAKAMCRGCEARLACLTGALRAQGALGCLGWRAADPRRDRAAQAPSRASSQDRSRPRRTGPRSQRRSRGEHEPRDRVPHTMHTTEMSAMSTEMVVRERTRSRRKKPNNCDMHAGCGRCAGPAGSSSGPSAGWSPHGAGPRSSAAPWKPPATERGPGPSLAPGPVRARPSRWWPVRPGLATIVVQPPSRGGDEGYFEAMNR